MVNVYNKYECLIVHTLIYLFSCIYFVFVFTFPFSTEISQRGPRQRGQERIRLRLVQQGRAGRSDRGSAQTRHSHRSKANLCQSGKGVRPQKQLMLAHSGTGTSLNLLF